MTNSPEKTKKLLETLRSDGTLPTNKSEAELSRTKVVVFFGAYWHQWARQTLLPKLKENYDQIMAKCPGDVEFLFVSCDKTKEDCDKFARMMPWPVLDYDNTKVRNEFTGLFVQQEKFGYPHVVVIHADTGRVYNSDAVQNITSGKEFPWLTSGAEMACMACASLVFCTVL